MRLRYAASYEVLSPNPIRFDCRRPACRSGVEEPFVMSTTEAQPAAPIAALTAS
jgi:hypothetical protein